MCDIKIAVIGGDRRLAIVAASLAAKGAECSVFGLDGADIGKATRCTELGGALKDASAVVLPLPVSRDGKHLNAPLCEEKISLKQVDDLAAPTALFLGGMIKQDDFEGRWVSDYYEQEELQLLNTIPTAEGAIAIAMEALPTTLHGTKSLIMGLGRVGKTLAIKLLALGAKVSVATRNPAEKAVCNILGIEVVEYKALPDRIEEFGLIFNTVPALLLTGKLLKRVKDTTPIIDLATHPGGVDATAGASMGKRIIWALGLPGKVAPQTAGEYISQTVINILEEEDII